MTNVGLAALVLVCGVALPLSAPGPAAAAAPDDTLPITRITLYRSGVGSFERRALFDGAGEIQLRFKTDQINDILKSMVVLDLDKGSIDSVSYGSKEPLERRLASFGVDISDDPPAARLLGRLRGTPVRLTTQEGEVSGTIMNVESRPTIVGGGNEPPAKHDLPWMNLVTPAGVRSVNLTNVTGFEILDKALAEELNKALAALAEHRADRVKTVDLALSGEGARRIVVAYVHEMPVWKTSYRLVLPDGPTDAEGAGKGAGQPTIQGWAIVENTTDEDWNDVRLSLVAGRPVSFQMDLYEPLHIERPEIPVPMVAGAMPRVYDLATAGQSLRRDLQDRDGGPEAGAAGERARRGVALSAPGRPGGAPEPAPAEMEFLGKRLETQDMLGYAARAQARAGDVGEVFQYELENPVSIARQRSAMLPILSAAIEGRRVSIYNRADNPEHPMRGVELKNNTGLQLMPGPISVYDGAIYAGDAQIGHTTLNDKRLLAYAVDLDVSARVADANEGHVRKVRIVNGVIEQTTLSRHIVHYFFENKDAKRARTVLVEHPKSEGWKLTEPSKAAEETQALYRFDVPLEPGKGGDVKVVQEWVQRQTLAVTSFDWATLLAYSKDGRASQAVLDAVKKASELQGAISATERKLQQLDRERAEIDADQNRLRQNMQSIDSQSELYARYLKKLSDQETRLETILATRGEEQATLNRQREALNAYLAGLNVE